MPLSTSGRRNRPIPPELSSGWDSLYDDDLLSAQLSAERILAEQANHAEALQLLGLVHARRGDHTKGAALLRQAAALEPDNLSLLRNLGTLEAAAGQWLLAAGTLAKPAMEAIENGELAGLFGKALLESGRHAEALAVLMNAMELTAPPAAGGVTDLGRVLAAVGRYEEARTCFLGAMAAGGDPVELQARLAVLALLLGTERAVSEPESGERDDAFDLAIGSAKARNSGDLKESIRLFRRALACGAVLRGPHSAWLHGLLQQATESSAVLREEHERWARLHCSPADPEPDWANSRVEGRRLRIGYLSGEFRCTPMYYFLWPILREHDRANVEVYCYNLGKSGGACTEQFRGIAQQWRDCRGMHPRSVAGAIRRDQVDILVDLCGHLCSDGLLVHQHRPAPISVSYPNYQFTTGAPSIHYLVTDHLTSPAGTEGEYCEELLRLSSGCLTWEPPEGAPTVTDLPAASNGFITFGLFQQPGKYNDEFWDLAAKIVRETSRSEVLIHHAFPAFDDAESSLRCGIENALTSRGVSPERLHFRGPLPVTGHLALLAEADIALDTFPFNGQTTTCECLWMGVPVITKTGSTHVGRVATALLVRAGQEKFVARTNTEYSRLALDLASEVQSLVELRRSLRQCVAQSPLTDARAVAAGLEESLREVWKRWCALSVQSKSVNPN